MINSKTDYDLFIFRDDNREKLDHCHVKKLCASIKARNLLSLRPIDINEKLEIIDGQHRLLAAKELGVEIFYKITHQFSAEDIIRLNVNKCWTVNDYFNFYCAHNYPEYLKLKDFIHQTKLNLSLCLSIEIGRTKKGHSEFKEGKFVFASNYSEEMADICRETIEYIKKMNGVSLYTNSNRFWKALLKLVSHPSFDYQKWIENLYKNIYQFSSKAKLEDYLTLLQNVYNWRNNFKIRLIGEVI